MSAPDLRALVVDDATAAQEAGALTDRIGAHLAYEHTAVGPLAVRDDALPALATTAEQAGVESLPITVVVSGGAGAIEPAVRWAARARALSLTGLVATVRDLDDLARGAHRVAAMVQMLDADELLDDATIEVALPLDARELGASRWQHALDTLAMEDLRLALRTGGATATAPDAPMLAAAIVDALDREVAFSCHGGLERAVGLDAQPYGFVDVLLATRASLDGEDVDAVAAHLGAGRTLEQAAADLASVEPGLLASPLRWFSSFSSTDVSATLGDLDAVGLQP